MLKFKIFNESSKQFIYVFADSPDDITKVVDALNVCHDIGLWEYTDVENK